MTSDKSFCDKIFPAAKLIKILAAVPYLICLRADVSRKYEMSAHREYLICQYLPGGVEAEERALVLRDVIW